MAINTIPVSTTGKPQGKGSKKSTGPGRGNGKRKRLFGPMPIPREGKQNEALTNMFQLMKGGPMQISKQGVPYKVLVGDPNEDPGYLRPPTQQDIEYSERLDRARQLKESGRLPGGRDPVAVEQRITAAERQTPTWRDEGDSLRESIYGKSLAKKTLSNVGDMLTGAYKDTLGKMVPFAHLPGGVIHNAGWSAQPNQAEGWDKYRILAGEGTPFDRSKRWQRKLDLYKHKYYGESDPGPRPRNVYDDLGMSQPKSITPMIDFGQRDIPLYLRSAGEAIDRDFGPAKVPPPGSELDLPAGALEPHGLSTRPYFTNEQKAMLRNYPMEKLPPQLQDYVKRLSSEPEGSPMIDLSGGRGEEKEEDEGKKRFNILELLLGLLGLPLKLLGLGPDEKKKEKTGKPYQPQRQQIPWQTENRMNQPSYTARQKSITK